MTERALLVCDRCGRTGEKPKGSLFASTEWVRFYGRSSGDLCPDCAATFGGWVAHRAEIDEKDPTALVAQEAAA